MQARPFLVVTYVPADSLPSTEESYLVWTALGLPPDLLGHAAVDWRSKWEGGQRLVSDAYSEDPDILDDLCNTSLSVLSLRHFTESRWLATGLSYRSA